MIHPARIVPYRATREVRSPNHGVRSVRGISLVILHATADGGNELGAEAWMTNPKSQASAHLHIRRDGSVTRHVPDDRRAWHAGASSWPDIADVNSESLGWEIANRNDGKEPYTDAQHQTVARLLAHYLPQGIDRAGVLTHAQIAPGRKTDPRGWDFDRMWRELDRQASYVPTMAVPVRQGPPLDLRRIKHPTPAHLDQIARVRRLTTDEIHPGLIVAEVLLRGIATAVEDEAREKVKEAADALADWVLQR